MGLRVSAAARWRTRRRASSRCARPAAVLRRRDHPVGPDVGRRSAALSDLVFARWAYAASGVPLDLDARLNDGGGERATDTSSTCPYRSPLPSCASVRGGAARARDGPTAPADPAPLSRPALAWRCSLRRSARRRCPGPPSRPRGGRRRCATSGRRSTSRTSSVLVPSSDVRTSPASMPASAAGDPLRTLRTYSASSKPGSREILAQLGAVGVHLLEIHGRQRDSGRARCRCGCDPRADRRGRSWAAAAEIA